MRILTLQPYYGESHKQFIDGWIANSRHDWHLLALPGRHWKWRMRHAAIEFAGQIESLLSAGNQFDAIVATDMMNVAELKGFLSRGQTSGRDLPLIVYFHENQFAYPSRFGFGSDQFKRDQHFAFTNFVSALAADEVWLNSQFNADSLVDGLRLHAKRWPDLPPLDLISRLPGKFSVHPPGIEAPPVDLIQARATREQRATNGEPIHIVWAARWEHDKNPEGLLEGLRALKKLNVDFRLSVLGQRFRQVPTALDTIKSEFDEQIQQWGFVENRDEYWRVLAGGDLFVSTAHHEFFGLAAAEAIAAGLTPVFPDRVAYPELVRRLQPVERRLSASFLYGNQPEESCCFANALHQIDLNRRCGNPWQPLESDRVEFVNQLNWATRSDKMDSHLTDIVDKSKSR